MTPETPINPLPRVSVLTAVYNGERFLDAAIASIMAQTFSDFEYILIDDASVDTSPAILSKWAASDSRIRLLHNPRNLNAAGALNRALGEARGEYIAILDHDDIAFPTRLATEVAFLDTHPDIGVVGGQALFIDEDFTSQYTYALPTTPILVRWSNLFTCPMVHSTVLMRRRLVLQAGGYNPSHWAIPDFDLYTRLLQVTQLTNLPVTLSAYRRSSGQISTRHVKFQVGQVALRLQATYWELFGIRPPLPAILCLYAGANSGVFDDEDALSQATTLFEALYSAFIARTPLSASEEEAVRLDYAARCLVIALNSRRRFRRASHTLLARGLELDPNLWANCRQKVRYNRQLLRFWGNDYAKGTRQ